MKNIIDDYEKEYLELAGLSNLSTVDTLIEYIVQREKGFNMSHNGNGYIVSTVDIGITRCYPELIDGLVALAIVISVRESQNGS